MTIWKFPISGANSAPSFPMPMGAEILSLQLQNGVPTIWALVDETAPPETVTFGIYGTGYQVPENPGKFIGTFQPGPYVFHVFRK